MQTSPRNLAQIIPLCKMGEVFGKVCGKKLLPGGSHVVTEEGRQAGSRRKVSQWSNCKGAYKCCLQPWPTNRCHWESPEQAMCGQPLLSQAAVLLLYQEEQLERRNVQGRLRELQRRKEPEPTALWAVQPCGTGGGVWWGKKGRLQKKKKNQGSSTSSHWFHPSSSGQCAGAAVVTVWTVAAPWLRPGSLSHLPPSSWWDTKPCRLWKPCGAPQ